MTITVQISDFRNNLASYIDQMIASQGVIEVKKGARVVAEVLPRVKPKKTKKNKIDLFLESVESLRKKYGGIKMNAKTPEDLVNEIDRIVYGVDRNGKELSNNDRQ